MTARIVAAGLLFMGVLWTAAPAVGLRTAHILQNRRLPAERASMDEPLILDRYRLIERIASGGSAEVWRAQDEQLDRPVAVKRLHPHLLPDEASRKRLAAEARAAAGLSHPVVVGVYDVDATGEAPALIMELVDGESLSARIARDGPLSSREAAAVTADLAEALFHAHQRGVIHRDVKPGNVLLGIDGRTRLVDFGIAHSLAASAERLTLVGTVIGTLNAMAPEQLADRPITPRTDLYGLGVVLHEALTGRPPYDASSPLALADAQRAGPPHLSGVEPALAAVVAGCLAYDPADRPLHAGALAAALRGWLAGEASAALALGPPPDPVDTAAVTQPVPVVPAMPAAPAAAGAVAAAQQPSRRRGGLVPLAIGAAALGVVLAGAAMLARADADGGGLVTASPTPTATVASTPPPTPVPEWLRKLVEEVEKHCGADAAAEAEATMGELGEDAAKEHADELIEACKEDGGGGGNGGNGGGPGGGNGGGEGRGDGGDD